MCTCILVISFSLCTYDSRQCADCGPYQKVQRVTDASSGPAHTMRVDFDFFEKRRIKKWSRLNNGLEFTLCASISDDAPKVLGETPSTYSMAKLAISPCWSSSGPGIC